MIQLSDYGKCIEEYVYSFEGKEVKEINYTLHDEVGGDITVIGVYKDKEGICRRSIIKWKSEEGTFNDEVKDMKLYLDTANRQFNFDDITVYSYDSSKSKDIVDEEYKITVDIDNKNFYIFEDKHNVAVYDSVAKMFKVYGTLVNGSPDYSDHIEDVRLTSFGVITEEESGTVYVMRFSNTVDIYEYELTNNSIECLEKQCNHIKLADESEYNIVYMSDGMVAYVDDGGDKLYSRSEIEEVRDIIITDSIYPTLVTQNYDNFQYNFRILWSHDHLEKDKFGNIILFTRYIYNINKEKVLLTKLNETPDKLLINY